MICPIGRLKCIALTALSFRIIPDESVGYCSGSKSLPSANCNFVVLTRSRSTQKFKKSVLSLGSFPSHTYPHVSLQFSDNGALVLQTATATPDCNSSCRSGS